MSELINNTIDAIKANKGSRMKMGAFCSEGSSPCSTTYCLAGWIVVAQPTFDEKETIDLFDFHNVGMTWESVIEHGCLDTYLQDTAAELLKEHLDIDNIKALVDLFYLHTNDEELSEEQQNFVDLCVKAGFIKDSGEFVGNLDTFDLMPDEVRMDAAVKVLEILRDERKVDWNTALRYAVEKYVCKKSVW